MDDQINFYWLEVCNLLQEELTEIAMDIWIRKLTLISLENNELLIRTDSDSSKITIDERYLYLITNTVRKVFEKDIIVRIVSPSSSLKKEDLDNENFYRNPNLKPKYVFESFVRGKSNELAYAACVAISESPGTTSYNPLFLYGGVGLGKTHLMQSIGNYVLDKNKNTKVLYCSTETFTNELITSIRERKNQEFRNKYREIDLLLIDDIQFLSDKEGTQEEFFHTFNTLYEANKQIVISSDQPPKELKTLEDRLRSRFGCGLIVDITFPDFETRVAILEKKAEIDNVMIPKDVTKFIAKNIVSNIRELEGALNKVIAFATLCKTPVNINLTEKALRDLISADKRPPITVPYIQDVVSEYYNVTPEDLRGRKRTQNFTYPRQIAMYLSRKLIDLSLPKIGDQFGGRDHTTVIHACDKISQEIEANKELSAQILQMEREIKGEFSVDNL